MQTTVHRVRDALAGAAATIILLTIVVGVPAALVVFVGWPLPTVAPTPTAVGNALRYGTIAPATLLKLLAVVVWGVWLAMTVSIMAEVVAVVQGTIARSLPVGGLQMLAGRLVATAMLLSTLTARPAVAAPVPAPAVAASAHVDDTVGEVTEAAEAPVPADVPADEGPTWVVKRHDSLWTIAERALGDGHRWRDIRDLNAGRRQPDGGQLSAKAMMIRPGWVLRLPAAAARHRARDVVTVRRGDHLWGIAEEHLGDGERWREIYRRNKGRPQADGGALTRPDIVLPGWVLRLPDDGGPRADSAKRDASGDQRQAHDGDAPAPTHGGHGDSRAPARDGDASAATHGGHGDSRAPARDGDASAATHGGDGDAPVPRRNDHAGSIGRTGRTDANDARTGHRDNADSERPTPVTALPLTPSTAPPSPAVAGTATPPAPSPSEDPSAPPSAGPAPTSATTPLLEGTHGVAPISGVAVLATALVGLLMARRRRWLRRRDAGAALDPIDPEAAETERWLRSVAAHDLTQRLERVRRLLSEHFAFHDVAPEVVAIELGERIELRLATADTACPPGVTVSDDSRTWTLDDEFEMAAPADRVRADLLPALVCGGQRPSGATVMLNLLTMGVVEVTGDAERVHEAVTAWTAELATNPTATVEVVVVGAHHDMVEQFTAVSIATDARAALARAERGRAVGSDVVVLRTAAIADSGWDELAARAAEDPGLAVVSPGQPDATYRVQIDEEAVAVAPLCDNLRRPEWLTGQHWDRFDELLRQPMRAQSAFVAPPVLHAAGPHPLTGADGDPIWDLDDEPDAEPAREVRVLGRLEVAGLPVPGADWADPLAYLATHRAGATTEQMAGALGCDHSRATRLVGIAAEHLGADDDGRPLLVVNDGRYRLAPAVACDVERMHGLVADLRNLPAPMQAERLSAALALIRGAPLSDAGAWAHAEGLVTATTALVSDLAHRLTTLAMTFGDLDRASWAAAQGLLANPACELLHRDRMRICDARGDHAGLDAVMRDVRRSAAADGDWVMPETLQLYERLKRPQRDTAAPTTDRRHAAS